MLMALLSIGGHTVWAQEAAAQTAPVAAAAHSSGSDVFSLNFIAAISFILLEVFVIVVMLIRIWALLNVINPKPETAKRLRFEFPKMV
jgi:hypothetical protein